MLQNYRYFAVRANNVVFDFSVVDFPLMNLYDLLIIAKIFKSNDYSKLQQVNNKDFMISNENLKIFIDGYYGALASTDINLDTTLGKKVYVPNSRIKNQSLLKNYEDGEICLKPLGIVFVGKNKKGPVTKFLFQMDDIEKYTSSHYTNFLIRMKSCAKNSDKEKAKIQKMFNWYTEIRRVLHTAIKLFTTYIRHLSQRGRMLGFEGCDVSKFSKLFAMSNI